MIWYQSKAYSIGWTRKLWKNFAAIEFLQNILQFIQFLISSILDFLKRKWKWYTSNIQQTANILRHFRKCSSKSSDQSCFMCTDRWRSERKLSILHEVALISWRQFIPWKLSVRWNFINQNWYSHYFTVKVCSSFMSPREPLPPNILPFVLIVNKRKNEHFITCFGYLLPQIKLIMLIIFLSHSWWNETTQFHYHGHAYITVLLQSLLLFPAM
jgi:hypothetical protein